MRLFSNRSQTTSKCGKNKKVAHEAQPSVSLMFLPHFDVHCDLLLNRRTATWNLFVKLIIIMQKWSARIRCKNNLFKPCKWHCAFSVSKCCDIQGSLLIGYLWVSLIVDQSECLAFFLLCTELTLFCIKLPENCICLNQSELVIFFIYIVNGVTRSGSKTLSQELDDKQ